jgi:hypothetical protein
MLTSHATIRSIPVLGLGKHPRQPQTLFHREHTNQRSPIITLTPPYPSGGGVRVSNHGCHEVAVNQSKQSEKVV